MNTTLTPGGGFTLAGTPRAAIANPTGDRMSLVEPSEGCSMRPERPDFSLVLGGPLFQLYRWTHLSGDALEPLHRRALVTTLFAWLPLLFLSMFESHATGAAIKIPFLHDVEANARKGMRS